MFEKFITYSFYVLFFLTPLVWTRYNFELFEFNKMLFVYLLTVLISTAWLLRMLYEKRLIFKTTPLDIPLFLFLASQILSTIHSIDVHTSIWGYYSRSNGGLLSIISYLILYWALVSNLDKAKVINLLKSALGGAVVVSLWAIPEHFGVSPSCVLLRGEYNADCWIQDVQARVFASLGQPNWLAAYLAMIIFPAIYFFLQAKDKYEKLIYFVGIIIFYLAFTFTYSRGGALGFLAGLGVLIGLYFAKNYWFHQTTKTSLKASHKITSQKATDQNGLSMIKQLSIIIATIFAINLFFGSALTRFQLSEVFNQDQTVNEQTTSALTQLESGGTESGQIRLIVWQGALDIFKNFPVYGSGVETFAYSYYLFRPAAHNLVSEWDFLYNKAHNEFLNYLATTGILGFGSYLIMILFFIVWSIKQFLFNKDQTSKTHSLLLLSLLAAYISFLVQNIFGFSVVIIALFFFLFPAIVFVVNDATKPINIPKPFNLIPNVISFLLYKSVLKSLLPLLSITLVVCIGLFLTSTLYVHWHADKLFALGVKESEDGNAGSAYNYLLDATDLNDGEPYYKSELGFAAAAAAVALHESDATTSAQLRNQAVEETKKALTISPNNPSYWRTAIRTYYQLSVLDPSFIQTTLETIDQTIKLAPTDPKLYYNKAIILANMEDDKNSAENTKTAIETLQKAIELKSNYREGYIGLALIYYDDKKYKEAVGNMHKVLQLVPSDPEVIAQLNDWGKKGIATESAQVTSD